MQDTKIRENVQLVLASLGCAVSGTIESAALNGDGGYLNETIGSLEMGSNTKYDSDLDLYSIDMFCSDATASRLGFIPHEARKFLQQRYEGHVVEAFDHFAQQRRQDGKEPTLREDYPDYESVITELAKLNEDAHEEWHSFEDEWFDSYECLVGIECTPHKYEDEWQFNIVLNTASEYFPGVRDEQVFSKTVSNAVLMACDEQKAERLGQEIFDEAWDRFVDTESPKP